MNGIRARTVVALIAAATALLVCGAYRPLRSALLTDNQHYFYIAERAADGVAPHLSHVDSKTQLTSLLAAAVIAAARPLGGDDVLAARAVGIAMVAATALLVASLAFDLAGGIPAALLATALLCLAPGLFLEGALGVRPQIAVAFFVLLAHAADLRGRHKAAGAAAACAFLCWQPALLVAAALAAGALLRPDPWRSLGRLAAGAVLPVLLYEAYFVLQGAAGAQLFQEFVLPTSSIHAKVDLAASFDFILSQASETDHALCVLPVLGLAAMLAAWAALLAAPRRGLALLRQPGRGALWLAANGALAFTLYDHQGHPDLLFVQPYFAVAAAVAAAGALSCLSGVRGRALVTAAAALSLLVAVAQARAAAARYVASNEETLADQRRLAASLAQLAGPGGGVWACGPVHLLGFLHTDNFSPYGFLYDDLRQSGLLDGFRPERDGRMPDLILIGRAPVPLGFPWMGAEYDAATPPAFARAHIDVLRRRDGAAGAPAHAIREVLPTQ